MTNKEDILKAFRGFNFEGDVKWQSYIKTVEIPGGNAAAALEKVKAKWYKKNVEPEFELEWATAAASKPASTAQASSTPKPDSSSSQPQQPQASQSSGAYANLAQGGLMGLLAGKPDGSPEARRLLAFHLAYMVLGLVAALPIGSWSARAYVMALRITITGMAYKIYLMHGLPSIRPMSAIMEWVQRVMPGSEFHWMVLALSFPAYPPYIMLLVPLWITSLYALTGYASRNMSGLSLWQKYGARVQQLLSAKQHDVLVSAAGSEIMLGGVLVLAQLSARSRNIMQAFLYWQLLRMRYHVPGSAAYHRQAWASVNQRVAPLLARVPPLQTALSYAQRWFTSLPGPQAQRP